MVTFDSVNVGNTSSYAPNSRLGAVLTYSNYAVVDTKFGKVGHTLRASFLKIAVGGTGGDIVYATYKQDGTINTVGVINLVGAGDQAFICCDIILSTATIDGTAYNTTATEIIYGVCCEDVGGSNK